MQHSLQLCWRLGLISADNEQREEDGEQAATGTKQINTLSFKNNAIKDLFPVVTSHTIPTWSDVFQIFY